MERFTPGCSAWFNFASHSWEEERCGRYPAQQEFDPRDRGEAWGMQSTYDNMVQLPDKEAGVGGRDERRPLPPRRRGRAQP